MAKAQGPWECATATKSRAVWIREDRRSDREKGLPHNERE